jgi:hypothetical protein
MGEPMIDIFLRKRNLFGAGVLAAFVATGYVTTAEAAGAADRCRQLVETPAHGWWTKEQRQEFFSTCADWAIAREDALGSALAACIVAHSGGPGGCNKEADAFTNYLLKVKGEESLISPSVVPHGLTFDPVAHARYEEALVAAGKHDEYCDALHREARRGQLAQGILAFDKPAPVGDPTCIKPVSAHRQAVIDSFKSETANPAPHP